MSSRDSILGDIRQALGRGALDEATRRRLDERSAEPPRHVRPPVDDADRVARFIERFESRAGTTARLTSLAQVPGAVAVLAEKLGLPHTAVVGRALGELNWPEGWQIDHGAATSDATLGVSLAWRGVAETGAVMMCSGPDSPITHNFVPENHVVVVPVERIVRHYEDCWADLRSAGQGAPRAMNFISGPSRTADVEQTVELGAHGPRRMHVLIVG
ncbi:lactate utilization protein C [Nitrogeniibacter mangrovi]|uniref:Lactate utilization protein C n=1 Tax=Nitrogeniibacter mangrovi TaxID=2016596 RepID=A0A6C1B2M5_9RHOO|nr:LUD domain-containing protein [Nitrogeniibacter mangrovi]QID16600.1 lactate utilization protein C [Nitrogeniibacter mangrovi]